MKRKTLEIQKAAKGEVAKATLFIDDELSFINCNEIKEEVLKHLNEFDLLLIQANIAHIDLTGIQLLYAVRRSLEAINKQVKFAFRLNVELKNLVIRSGFTELFD